MSCARPRFGGSRALLYVQGLLGLGVLAVLSFAPPAEGKLLLLPLLPGAADPGAANLFRAALPLGGQPLGTGPLAGSIVVEGRRDDLWLPMLRRGVIIIAATPAGCLSPAPLKGISS